MFCTPCGLFALIKCSIPSISASRRATCTELTLGMRGWVYTTTTAVMARARVSRYFIIIIIIFLKVYSLEQICNFSYVYYVFCARGTYHGRRTSFLPFLRHTCVRDVRADCSSVVPLAFCGDVLRSAALRFTAVTCLLVIKDASSGCFARLDYSFVRDVFLRLIEQYAIERSANDTTAAMAHAFVVGCCFSFGFLSIAYVL